MRGIGVQGRGFSFGEYHSDDFGLIWAELPPEIFAVDHRINYQSESIAGVPGAIPHGYDVKPREFRVVCGFEKLTEGQRNRIGAWLRAGKYGRFTMDHRPYCYYEVMVTASVEWTETFPVYDPVTGTYLLSGHMEFTLTAFNPYAYLQEGLTLKLAVERGMLQAVLDGTALLPAEIQPRAIGNHAYLQNAGNAPAKLHILLDGVPGPEGIQIINHTTGQWLTISGDTEQHTYHIDSAYGRVEEFIGDEVRLASHVHDGDYLEVSPGCPMERDLTYVQLNNRIVLQNRIARHEDVGRYFYHGQWSKILDVQDGNLIVDHNGSGSGEGVITQLNDIEVVRGEGADLTVTFDMKPTFY